MRVLLGTLGSRVLVMVFALTTVLLNTHFLGDSGQGEVALFNFGVMVLLAVAHYAGGGALVYLAPRMSPGDLWRPAYVWSVVIGLLAWLVFSVTHVIPEGYAWAVGTLGAVQSLYSFHMQVLLGMQRIRAYNTLQLIHAGLLTMVLVLAYTIEGQPDLSTYVVGAGTAIGATYITALGLNGSVLRGKREARTRQVIQRIFKFSGWAQTGNVFQTLAYRLPVVLLEAFFPGNTAIVGVFSINTYASEAIWNVGKSFSLVQLARLVNDKDPTSRNRLTLTFLRWSAVITLPMVVVAACLPESWWTFVLGEGFGDVHVVLAWTAAGILANAMSTIVSHHFAGTGMHRLNAQASALGCAAVLGVGWWRVPAEGLVGAAQAFTAGMVLQWAISTFWFIRRERLSFHALLSFRHDRAVLRQ